MFLDRATTDANHRRFIERIIASETVWYLDSPDGVATSISNDDEETTILIFWSDRAYATRARKEEFADYEETEMDLFNFLFQWLPGMSGDGVLAGTNWTGDLIGNEYDPYELRVEIEDAMPEDLKERHRRQYEESTG